MKPLRSSKELKSFLAKTTNREIRKKRPNATAVKEEIGMEMDQKSRTRLY